MGELRAKVEQEAAEKLQGIAVHKELELELDLGNLLASDRNPPTVLRQAGPLAKAELRTLARDNTQLLISQLLAAVPAPKGHQAQEDQPRVSGAAGATSAPG